ncbi:MAG: hypothetical protein Q4G24_11000 [Paracoccus sp. (in: a-proteobacteria)]|uniref:hypothetical protein n=1 Tax=Paracoccus sp. TaxID=267 RepID=UPI0026E0BBE0|nr:hypothetical protein [Paracoccus sp. (in: a-proteobacteria)]MDO5621986.1 hypothetical protein [Paracoccus sp. (in: a-proteobacteria)]
MVQATLIERQWVPTGADFALSHPLAQRLGSLWLLVGWCALVGLACLMASIWLIGFSDLPAGWLMAVVMLNGLLFLMALFAIVFLILRRPQAIVPVWIVLILTLPFSVPLMAYWANGTRPNLVYRHRFARLVEATYDRN